MSVPDVIVAGAGVFGVTAALELRRRGRGVVLVDPGPLPHPLAASTDISKVVRMEYGADEAYMALMEVARDGWLAWNERWQADGRPALYHETGVTMFCTTPMAPGGFEHDSYRLLVKRGHSPERVTSADIAARFPAWRADRFVDGFFHAKGGFAESGRVVSTLIEEAEQAGVTLREGVSVAGLIEEDGRVVGVQTDSGEALHAGSVLVAAGAWAASLVPELQSSIRATGHPVFHLAPPDPELFAWQQFPAFCADVSRTGYYGFPVSADGVVKIANHGLGTPTDPAGKRELASYEESRLRAFLAETFPALTEARIVYTRLCLYADTPDEHFWIARDPKREGLTVAGGGSGHGFKFAPVLGGMIADAVEGVHNETLERFRWRTDITGTTGEEAARCHDKPPEA